LNYGVLVFKNYSTSQGEKQENEIKMYGYYVMPKYEMSVHDFVNEYQHLLTPSIVIDIILQLIEIIAIVHNAGYTHNHIRLTSLLVKSTGNTLA